MLLGSHLSPSWKSLVTVSVYAHGFPCLSLFIRGSKLPGTGRDGSPGSWGCGSTSQSMRDGRWWTNIQHVSPSRSPVGAPVTRCGNRFIKTFSPQNSPFLFVISPLCHAEWASWDHLPNKLFVSKSLVLFLAELTLRWYINLSGNTTPECTHFQAQVDRLRCTIWISTMLRHFHRCFCLYVLYLLKNKPIFSLESYYISLMTQYSFLKNHFEQGVWLNSLSS